MIDLTGVTHHPVIEEIVEVLCNKTENTDKSFFRTGVAYFIGKMASCMRAAVVTKDRGTIPVNIYAMALATSGYGKGRSVSVIETELVEGFRKRFMDETLTVISDQNFWVIANERAVRNNSDPGEEYEKVQKEYRLAGAFAFTFDKGTEPAVKQLRQKLLLANCGSINFQVDEIGSNLEANMEVLTLFLELYDQGQVKQKLTKSTSENTRSDEVTGKTPTNMLLFGTPSKLFDGSKIEDIFYSLLDTGYARRCLFGHGMQEKKSRNKMTPKEIFYNLINPASDALMTKWADRFHSLADPARFGWKMSVEDDVAIQLITYKVACEHAAQEMSDFQNIQKAELEHRYFKALKLAGAFAFVDGSMEVEMDHLMQAILLVEESGTAFAKILTREKAHVRLGRYVSEIGTELTQHDLTTALPFYKGSINARQDMMNLAMSWGYKHNVIIKKSFVDGIEFFRGEKLKETNLEEMIFSYSSNWAYDYEAPDAPVAFDQLRELVEAPDMHWANHTFKNKHRAEENVNPGFNMLVLDVDGGISTEVAHELLQEYKFMTYTTKRSTPENNRFRLIMPINYVLELDKDEYKQLVQDVMSWLPFKATADVDMSSTQRSKKWLSNEAGIVHYNLDGAMLDILPFIPKTSKNEQFREGFKAVASLDNLERWFAQRMGGEGSGRNNLMIKFALALVDSGLDFVTVSRQVHEFDRKLSSPIGDEELNNTVMVTVAKRFQKKAA